jgi:diphthamide biosynthesis methyltransferase
MVESSSDEILADADTKDIAFLVVGDPFSATTHTDLALRCRQHDFDLDGCGRDGPELVCFRTDD